MSKEQAKQKIQKLIDRYEALSPQEMLMNEETTKAKFIRPLFEALGWDFEEDVLLEDNVSHKRVDYNFRINGRTKFFLEAKPLKADIDNLEYAKQATNYAWLKNVNWAILSDFEGIRVFYPAERGQAKSCRRFNYRDYVTNFDELWILSKESFQSDLLDKRAIEWGAKPEEIKVSKQLAEDMNTWRNKLSHNLHIWNNELTEDQLDEGVQKILDRFIFMRSCEDRGLEDDTLQSRFRIWRKEGHKEKFLNYLKPLVEEYRKTYNSGLFDEHLCEKFNSDTGDFDEIIRGLYHSKNGQDYNFKDIDADALGSVYEQYLGHLLQKASKTDKDDSKKKRKSQGIYYTPTFIVDYIVENTVGRVLKEKNLEEIANLKILDPACGSGSFLIKAFDYLANYQAKKENARRFALKSKLGRIEQAFKNRDGENELPSTKKIDILRNNIYGVDLDQQAVEIAQLNLLLKALDQKQKLPHLSNIKCGNSLIDSKKIAGQKAFNWQDNFSEVMGNGGFDIIIGNPPYLKEMDNKKVFEPIKRSNYQKYYQGKMDLWYFFLHRAIDVAKKGAYIAFITNSYFLKSEGASKLIDRIRAELVLLKVVDLGDAKIFGDVSGRHIIHIYQKRNAIKSDKTLMINIPTKTFIDHIDEKNKNEILYINLFKNSKIHLGETADIDYKNCTALGNVYDTSVGIQESTDKVRANTGIFKKGDGVFVLNSEELQSLNLTEAEKTTVRKYLNTNDIGKYFIRQSNEYVIYSDKETKQKIASSEFLNLKKHLDKMKDFITSSNKPYGLHRPRENRFFENPKLICKGMFLSPEFCFDSGKHYVGFSFSVIIQKDNNYSLRYLLALLNSSLGRYWFNSVGKKRGVGVDIGVKVFRQFPVFQASTGQQKTFDNLVNQMLKLNENLQKVEKNTNAWSQTNSEINSTNQQIDQMVYKLYGLTPEEMKIIEGLVK